MPIPGLNRASASSARSTILVYGDIRRDSVTHPAMVLVVILHVAITATGIDDPLTARRHHPQHVAVVAKMVIILENAIWFLKSLLDPMAIPHRARRKEVWVLIFLSGVWATIFQNRGHSKMVFLRLGKNRFDHIALNTHIRSTIGE
jgi:hypothetical protein